MKVLVASILMITGFVLACGGGGSDEAVGATCRDDLDCEQRCMSGGDYPGGFCTLSCRDDRDCTSDSICIAKSGGICLFHCEVDPDCDFLGASYVCKDADDVAGVRVGVCLGR